jgi:hypothetical protein
MGEYAHVVFAVAFAVDFCGLHGTHRGRDLSRCKTFSIRSEKL